MSLPFPPTSSTGAPTPPQRLQLVCPTARACRIDFAALTESGELRSWLDFSARC